MKTRFNIAQLFLRLAIGLGFIFAVMDRLGWLGEAGENGNAWGNWTNFVTYTHSLLPYLNMSLTNLTAILATIGEAVFGILLIIGYKTKYAAWGSAFLTLTFALSMLVFSDFRAPFTYSVFVNSAAALLLAGVPHYKWSVDEIFS